MSDHGERLKKMRIVETLHKTPEDIAFWDQAYKDGHLGPVGSVQALGTLAHVKKPYHLVEPHEYQLDDDSFADAFAEFTRKGRSDGE